LDLFINILDNTFLMYKCTTCSRFHETPSLGTSIRTTLQKALLFTEGLTSQSNHFFHCNINQN